MKIVVCIKEVIDTNLNIGFGQISEGLMQKNFSYRLNPNDAEALSLALNLKFASSGTEVVIISIGTNRVEGILRQGLAIGADKAIRVADDTLKPYSPYQKAKILARTISIINADLILTGTRSLDNSSGTIGPLIAAWLSISNIYGVTEFQLEENPEIVIAFKNAGRGLREKVQTKLPAVLSIEGKGNCLPYASMGEILESKEAQISQLGLTDLGITPEELKNEPSIVTGISFPKPRPRAAPLDTSLPAFYRILALLHGGINKRQGQILKGNKEELINQLFDLLVKEKVIKLSLKPGK